MDFTIIKKSEGFRSRSYKCPADVPTIGYGSTIYEDGTKVKLTDPEITPERATKLLEAHVIKHCLPVINKHVTRKLNDNELSALVSFVYNTGGGYVDGYGQWQPFRLFALIQANAPEADLRAYWQGCAITAQGKKLNGLIARRKEEADLFFKK